MGTTNEDIRNAIETLLQSTNSQHNIHSPNADISHSQSINTLPSIQTEYVISQDLLDGCETGGRMSSVRRFFCLFVTFDLAFTGLMWIICIMITGENIHTAIQQQIFNYSIHTSLFDVVLLSVCRFIILLFFYGLLKINHWFVIALSTAATCSFLIAKVFQFDWVGTRQPVFEVLLIITSFIISWGEAWFLDFRVIPQEVAARRVFFTENYARDNERTPLVQSYVQNLPSMNTESVANFYSPLCSPEGSVYGGDYNTFGVHPPIRLTRDEENNFKCKGKKILQDSWRYLNSPDWSLEKSNKEGDSVYVQSVPNIGKLFKLTAVVNVYPRYLLDELFYKVECIPHWNPSLLESHKVQSIDENTDITYQISADAAGVVSSRDFVNLRHWGNVDGCYVIAYSAIEHHLIEKNKKYVRGENGIGCFVFRPIPGDCNKCRFEWLLNLNLKGWIPQSILDVALIGMMFDYVKYLRKHVSTLTESGRHEI